MDTAYNIYGNNAMGFTTTSLNNTMQPIPNQSVSNVIEMTNGIGINMVNRDFKRSLGGDTRSSATKKAKFTPSSKYKIEVKYSDYVKNDSLNNAKKMSDNVVSIDEYRKPIATESVHSNAPSAICQSLSEKIDPKTNQLERTITLHANVIGMNNHIFSNSCKPIKVNSRSITNCILNSENLEKYYGKPVESVQTNRNNDIDIANVDKKEVTASVSDAFKMPTMSLNDTFQLPSMELNSSIEKSSDTIEVSKNALFDEEMQQSAELPDKKINVTNEYNVDSLFKKDVDTTNFQMPSVDSLKADSIDMMSEVTYKEEPKKERLTTTEKRVSDYIDSTSSQDSLAKLKDAITEEAKKTADLQQVVGTHKAEIIDLEKEKEKLYQKKLEFEEKAKERYQSFVKTNETLARTRQEMEESLQKTQTDISNIMSEIEAYASMLEVKVPHDTPTSRGRRGKAA